MKKRPAPVSRQPINQQTRRYERPALGKSSDRWFRLIPWSGGEAAELYRAKIERDANRRPVAARYLLDRKLISTLDLVSRWPSPTCLVSERVASALRALDVPGVNLRELPHVTPNEVFGRRLFELQVEHALPGVLSSMERMGDADQPAHGWVGGIPFPPVRFAGQATEVPLITWSPWVGLRAFEWRGLIVHRVVLEGLLDALPDLNMSAEAVSLEGEADPPGANRPSSWARSATANLGRATAAFDETAWERVVAALPAEAAKYRHTLAAAGNGEVTAALRAANVEASVVGFFERTGVDALYARALQLATTAPDRTVKAMTADVASYAQVSADWTCIGTSPLGGMSWMLGADGLVRGVGKEDWVYGPEAPFWRWFVDQCADLRYAFDHQDEPWTNQMLFG